jgi:hypothetical protein
LAGERITVERLLGPVEALSGRYAPHVKVPLWLAYWALSDTLAWFNTHRQLAPAE